MSHKFQLAHVKKGSRKLKCMMGAENSFRSDNFGEFANIKFEGLGKSFLFVFIEVANFAGSLVRKKVETVKLFRKVW